MHRKSSHRTLPPEEVQQIAFRVRSAAKLNGASGAEIARALKIGQPIVSRVMCGNFHQRTRSVDILCAYANKTLEYAENSKPSGPAPTPLDASLIEALFELTQASGGDVEAVRIFLHAAARLQRQKVKPK